MSFPENSYQIDGGDDLAGGYSAERYWTDVHGEEV
jgi:hypothetical protein